MNKISMMKLSEKDRDVLMGLASVYGLGSVGIGKLVAKSEKIAEIGLWNKAKLVECGLSEQKASSVELALEEESLVTLRENLIKVKAQVVTIYDKEYPERLKSIAAPPVVLFVRGRVESLSKDFVAVVGTRKPSSYGRESVKQIVDKLAGIGVGVVSGMALGIDAVSHRAALDNELTTVAVLGSGVDKLLPASNFVLGKEIIDQGAVVSEYAPGIPSMRQNFPARNRIVAGMAMGVVVIEGSEKSGTLITAEFAREQDRVLWALPGEIGNPMSQAPNNLIRAGARVIAKPGDVVEDLEALGFVSKIAKQKKASDVSGLGEDERLVYEMLGNGKMHVDELIKLANKPPAWMLGALSILELMGLVRDVGGKEYVRID